MDEFAASLLVWLRKRSGATNKKLRASGLVSKVAASLCVDPLDVRGAFRSLRKAGLITYSADTMGLPYTGFVGVVAEVAAEPAASRAWREALASSGVEPELLDALLPSYALFADLDESDLRLAANGILRVRGAPRGVREFGFSISAREILGSSKVLDRLTPQARRLLGIEAIPSTPRYVVVAGPAKPRAVLLIENTTTYELAVRAGLDADLTLIAAYGYGLNMMSDSSAGWALVDSVTSGRSEVLSRSGRDHQLRDLFQHESTYFWGDLDREGLRIAMALRRKVPQLQVSGLYAPMCVMARDRATSHPYASLSGKSMQLPWLETGDELMDLLAGCCALRAVDQEAVDIAMHRHLAGKGLTGLPPVS